MATYITIETDKKIAYQIDGGEKNVMFANVEDDRYPEPTGTITITENGTGIDVKDYAEADVNVPGGGYPEPTGTITITQNGTGIDVKDYAEADVNVPTYPEPTGTKQISITQNGTTTENVKDYASAEITVNVSSDDTYKRIIEGDSTLTTINDSTLTKIKTRGCSALSGLTSATFANVTTTGDRIFEGCNNLQSASFPVLTTMGGYMFSNLSSLTQYSLPIVTNLGIESFKGTAIQYAVFPNITGAVGNGSFSGCPNLVAADFGPLLEFSGAEVLRAPLLSIIVIRKSDSVPKLGNAAAFTNSPFASGGTGGTIYIPKALYDHLGDGTSLDYKAATNWSTIDGYGTITWAQIEGSQYETHYVDGTLIPTT